MSLSKLHRSVIAGAFAAAMLIAATACNASGGSGPPVDAVLPLPSAPQSAVGLRTVDNAQLGTLVTDNQGWVLYRFDQDKNVPPTSTCAGPCATRWQPAAAVSDTQVQGVDQNLVGSVKRPDGSLQLTLNGWPLYRFTGDKNPGDTRGQGLDRVWFAADIQGGKAVPGARAKSATTQNGSDGY
ncbi:hypothetical protein ACIP98_20325 [Streptomyces sp. NPDC088354]|uniref:COG4315 family predicted lipoprotein n=1 Tax=Streptomyces sp. NPDC088354 TaxID=3365856 RepID=UPI00380341B5